MRRIKDERLIIKNLKNIRITFLVQTIGIVLILLYDVITEGLTGLTNNPLWLVFMISIVVLNFLNINVSMDVYDDEEKPKKRWPYYGTVIIIATASVVVGILQQLYSGDIGVSILVGSVVFICFLVPFTFAHYLRSKKSED